MSRDFSHASTVDTTFFKPPSYLPL